MSSIVIGLVVGYVLAWALEMVDFLLYRAMVVSIFLSLSVTVFHLIFLQSSL